MRYKILDFEERKIIEQWISEGKSLYSIAKILNRSTSSVRFEVERNGGKENYCAQKAMDRANILKNRRPKYKAVFNTFQSEIENLKMQIEILVDELRSLKSEKNKGL